MLIYIFVVIRLWCLMKVSLLGSSISLVVYYIFNTLCTKQNLLFAICENSCSYIYFKNILKDSKCFREDFLGSD